DVEELLADGVAVGDGHRAEDTGVRTAPDRTCRPPAGFSADEASPPRPRRDSGRAAPPPPHAGDTTMKPAPSLLVLALALLSPSASASTHPLVTFEEVLRRADVGFHG